MNKRSRVGFSQTMKNEKIGRKRKELMASFMVFT
jgi:hypothetical protein